jgi:VWA domain-containing protein/aerotolerance regulator-like protein
VSLLFPLGMAALGALVPLVLLYLLKQKRVEEKVPANFLWARALEDLRASSLFQRFRAPLLFLLQAASIALCALAAAGASLNLDVGGAPRRVVLLLDRSASMQCADEEGKTRFDVAKDLAADVVSGLSRGDEAMLVAFDARAEVLQAFTPDTERLRDVLSKVEARDLPTRAADALEVAVSFARASRGFDPEIIVISDGCVEGPLPAVPFPLKFAKVGKSGANQGIAAVSVTRTREEGTQVLVRVTNGDAAPAQRRVLLREGSDVLDARDVSLGAEGDATVVFTVSESDAEPQSAKTRLLTATLDGTDLLAADDRAPFVIRPFVPRNALVVRPEPTIHLDPDRLRKLRPELAVAGVSPAEAESTIAAGSPKVDLVFWDGVAPAALPDVPAQIYVNCLPPGSGLAETGRAEDPLVVDWSRTHPATVRCQFDDVFVRESMRLAGTERALTLVDSTAGPLILLVPVPGREVLVVAFDPSRSNLPLKLAWPLFLANSIDFLLAGTAREGEEPLLRTGTPLRLDPSRKPWKIEGPEGGKADVPHDAQDRPVFRDGVRTGHYRAFDAAGKESAHAFALLDAGEAKVLPRDTLTVGGEAKRSDPAGLQRNLLLRDPLLLAVLGLLVLEWAVWAGRQ